MCVSYRGGLFSRGGLAFVGRCKQSVSGTGPPRPIPFQFSITQGFCLEFGDQYLRFVFQGGYVVEGGVAITGVTQANPAVVSVSGTPYANGDWVFIAGVGGMTQLNGNTYIVTGATSGSFSLADLNGNPVDSTGFGAYTSGGDAYRLYTVVTPYQASDLPYLKVSQSADVMSLTCSNPITGREYPPYDLTRLSAIDWTLTETDFDAVISPPATVSAVANTQAPSTGVNATFAYEVTAVDAHGNESVASAIASCHGADMEVEAGTNTITWARVTGAKYYNVYRSSPSTDTGTGSSAKANPVPPGSILGYVGSAYGTQYIDNASVVDLTQTAPTHQNPFAPGQILAVNITAGGSGVTTVTYALTTAAGVNFAGYPAVVGGSLGAFPITNNGEFFQPGDSIAFNGSGFASGAIEFGSTNPSASDTVTMNGVVFTFVTAITAGNQVLIGGALSTTLATLASVLSASSNASVIVASYSVDVTNSNLLVTYKTAGTGGNAYTLAASAATPSAGTLTGGSGTGGSAPTATLAIGPTSGTYPGVVAYFQQRRFYANSLNDPDTFWASQTALFQNFDTSIPTIATDAITASPWTEQVNGIQWLIPMPGGLIAMTGLRAWQIIGEGTYQLNVQPVTPTTTQAQPQAFNGCSATVPPIVIDYDVLYIEAQASVVRDLSWNFWVNIYTGADLTILSSHLFLYRQIVQWTWARNPYKVVWACCNDGMMLSMTYLKEQEIYGWSRHDTLGLVVGITSVTEPPVNAVYAVVQRFPPYAPQGIYVMERMDNRIWQSVEDAFAVDSAVSNPLVSPSVSLYASAVSGPGVIFTAGGAAFSAASVGQVIRMGGGIATVTNYTSPTSVIGSWNYAATPGAIGLPFAAAGTWTIAQPVTTLNAPHLAGMTVVGLADGVPIPLQGGPAIVVGPTGLITLPFTASNVKVGLPFLPQVQTPYLNGNGVMQGSRKAIPAVSFRLAASGNGFQWGTNQPDGAAQNPPQLGPAWTNLTTANVLQPTGGQKAPPTYTSPGGQTVTELWTGDIRMVGSGGTWNSKGQVAMQQPLPLSLEILAVMPEVVDGDVPERGYSQENQGGSSPPWGTPPSRGPSRAALNG